MLRLSFVYPPSADPTTPPLALARIKGAAGFYLGDKCNFRFLDENQRFARYTIDLVLSGAIQEWVSEAQARPLFGELRRYLEKTSGLMYHLTQDLLKAMGVLKLKSLFLDISKYSHAYKIINKAFQIFSLPCYPATVGYATARLAVDIRRSEQIKKALSSPLLNPYFNYFKERLDLIEDADVLGISAVYCSQLVPALTLARLAKGNNKEIIVLLGGPCASTLKEVLRQRFGEFVDFVIPGDAEAFFEYLSRSNTDLEEKDSFVNATEAYLKEAPGTWFKSPDHLMDYSWAEINDYLLPEPVLCLDITRGCYYRKCAFCAYGYLERHYRKMNPTDVVAVIRDLREDVGATRFFFSVDVLDPVFLEQLSKHLIKANMDITYCFDARLEKKFADENFTVKLFESGCRAVSFGMESASQHTLDRMVKGTGTHYFGAIMEALFKAQVHVQIHLIHGFPGEMSSEFGKTIRFLKEHAEKITTVGVSQFALLKGSAMEKAPERYGIRAYMNAGDLSLDYDYEPSQDSDYPDFQSFKEELFSMFPVIGRLTGSTTDYLIYASHFSPAKMKAVLRFL